MKDFWTSVSRTHLALVATSMLLLALAIAPDESRTFDKAQTEALQLADVVSRLTKIDPAAVGVRLDEPDTREKIDRANLRLKTVASEYKKDFGTSYLSYLGPLEVSIPRPQSNVRQVLDFIQLLPVRYLNAPSDDDLRHAFEVFVKNRRNPKSLTCRSDPFDPESNRPCWELNDNMGPPELTMIHVDDFNYGIRGGLIAPFANNPNNLKPVKMVLIFRRVDETGSLSPLADDQLAVEFPVQSLDTSDASRISLPIIEALKGNGAFPKNVPKLRIVSAMCGKLDRALNSDAHDKRINSTTDLVIWKTVSAVISLCLSNQRSAFPRLTALIDEIGLLTPTAAAQQLHLKADASRQKFSLLGQSVDEHLIVTWGPVIVLSIAWFLLCELKATRRAYALYNRVEPSLLTPSEIIPAWIGAHSNWNSRLFVFFSVFFFPS